MNREIDELKDQYYDIKDISESELEVIEADIRSMEDRLEEKAELSSMVFADASTAAYGAVLYAQSISEEGCIYKTCAANPGVQPGETNHYPRLKCTFCVIVTAPGKGFTFPTLPIQQIMLWTDSNIR
ncbi:hypothetical protein TNIN_278011 [Trichonephila inaurata madagascariensis]|uniref:Uncharacterized protein n=1 Tax=Trichonephila inaurata madagascariensis TaxID=2747483 RepID=A0A8X6WWI1_9ARAC|nr:hypothetical protein TNIN_278011 [Trichonephila inaurata madagascariensis]